MTRERLPNRRPSEVLAVPFVSPAGRVTHMTVSASFFEDTRPAEIFIDLEMRAANEMASVMHDAAVVISIALQHGAPIETIRAALSREQDGISPASPIGAAVDAIEAAP